jgi:hypothetical protein
VSRVANPPQEHHLLLESIEDLEVVRSWIVLNQGVCTDNDQFEWGKLVAEDVAFEDSFIRDLLNEKRLFGKHPSEALWSNTDIASKVD